MENVRKKASEYITEKDMKDFEHTVKNMYDSWNEQYMAWILLVELITYINNDEEALLAKTVEKARREEGKTLIF